MQSTESVSEMKAVQHADNHEKKRKEKYSSFMLESALFRVESLANKVAYNTKLKR